MEERNKSPTTKKRSRVSKKTSSRQNPISTATNEAPLVEGNAGSSAMDVTTTPPQRTLRATKPVIQMAKYSQKHVKDQMITQSAHVGRLYNLQRLLVMTGAASEHNASEN